MAQLLLDRVAWQGFSVVYGIVCFCMFGTRAFWEAHVTKRPSKDFWSEVDTERNRIWDLSKEVIPGIHHAFETLGSANQLHYLTNGGQQRKHLVFFIHGWPDNCMLWTKIIYTLQKTNGQDTTFVAVDLPGHGGSQGLADYGPTPILEDLCEFICTMRKKCLIGNDGGKVVVVAHDLGALCGFKLAASAPQIADRFILANAPLTELAIDNVQRRCAFAYKMLRTWIHQPLNFRPLRSAASTAAPVLNQLLKSSYVFIYGLPASIAVLSGTTCKLWSLRFVSSLAEGGGLNVRSEDLVKRLAASLGPNNSSVKTVGSDGAVYSASTKLRAEGGAFMESIRLYREGLATKQWDKSLNTQLALFELDNGGRRSSSGAGLFEDGPSGALRAPTTIIWGAKDPALHMGIMMDGIGDYLAKRSQLVMLPDVGHWVPVEGRGPSVMSHVVNWSLEGEKKSLVELKPELGEFKVVVSR